MNDFSLADDVHLLSAIAAGRQAALAVLYDRLHRQCFSLALHVLRTEQDAEEAVQETFVRVWRSADRYNPAVAAANTWVLAITRNLCVDELRRRRRRIPGSSGMEEAMSLPSGDQTDREAVRSIEAGHVRSAMQSLPAEQRSAIALVYFHGLTSQEVASVLGIPAPTVRSRLRLGLLKLGGLLQEQGLRSD